MSLTVVDWQLTTRGRAVYDVAYFLGGNLDSTDRRNHELRLLEVYHTLLVQNGVADYPFDQCLNDYRLAMLQRIFRIAGVIGLFALSPEQERRFCDVIAPRYCRAVQDLDAGEALANL